MQVFLSYTRNKDGFGAVSNFRKHLESELRSHDSQAIVFQDTNDIEAGDHYPEKLESELKNADVLIVHLSPAWLKSKWCRWEFEVFTSNLTDKKRLRRVIPLLEVSTPALALNSTDPIAAALAPIEFVDITELRYENWDNPAKLKYAGRLAARIAAMAEESQK